MRRAAVAAACHAADPRPLTGLRSAAQLDRRHRRETRRRRSRGGRCPRPHTRSFSVRCRLVSMTCPRVQVSTTDNGSTPRSRIVKSGWKGRSMGGECLGRSFEPVEDDDHDGNLATDRFDGQARPEAMNRPWSRHRRHRHRRPRLKRSFDQVAGAMGLGFLSNQEAAQVAQSGLRRQRQASPRRSGLPPWSVRRRR